MNTAWLWLAAAVSSLLAAGCQHSQAVAEQRRDSQKSAAPTQRVAVVQPVRKTLVRATNQPGQIGPNAQAPLYAKVAGYVDELRVDIGAAVEERDILAVVEVPELEQELHQKTAAVDLAEAGVKQAEADVRVAETNVAAAKARVNECESAVDRAKAQQARWKSELARISELAAKGAVTRKLEDETRSQHLAAEATEREAELKGVTAEAERVATDARLLAAQAAVPAAQARRRAAQADRERTAALWGYRFIRAPFDGVVTERLTDVGHFVQPTAAGSKPMFVVVQVNVVRVAIDVPELDAAWINAGDRAEVRVQALENMVFPGRVARTAIALDPNSRTLRTEIDLDNKNGLLRPGMYANVHLVVEERPDVLVLPAAALFQEQGRTWCACLESGAIVRKPVQPGLTAGGEVEIVEGLDGHEQAVVKNGAALAEGTPAEAIAPEKAR